MSPTPTAQSPVSPAREDPVVAGASNLLGGPPGDHARPGDGRAWWTPIRVLIALTIIMCILGYAQKAPCRDTGNWSHEFQYTRMCYSDVVALFGQEGLADGKRPYLDYPTEYPPLIGGAMYLAASVAGLWPSSQPVYRTEKGQQVFDHYTFDQRTAAFYDVTFILFLVAAVAAVACTALAAGRRRVWDAALFALAPALALHLLTNWDILAVALAAGGILAWARGRPALAGVLFGLGVVTKLYPLFFLVGLAVLCARAGRARAFARTVAATLATALAVLVPVWLVAGYFDGEDRVGDGIWSTLLGGGDWPALVTGGPEDARNAVAHFYDLNAHRPPDWDSLHFAVIWLARAYDTAAFGGLHVAAMVLTAAILGVAGYAAARARPRRRALTAVAAGASWLLLAVLTPFVLTSVRDDGISLRQQHVSTYVAFGAALAGIVALSAFAPRRPRLPQVLFLILVAFLLTNWVFSPQYTIWLLPLVALARPRWPMFLAWQLTEAGVLFTRFLHFVYNDTAGADGVDRGWFVGAVAVRDVALLVLAGLVVREIVRPELDVVRASGLDDPAGGVLDGAPDAWFFGRSGRSDRSGRIGGRGRAGGPDAAVEPTPAVEPGAPPGEVGAGRPAAAPEPAQPPGALFRPRRQARPDHPFHPSRERGAVE
jgi:uncharacterized membrane protein